MATITYDDDDDVADDEMEGDDDELEPGSGMGAAMAKILASETAGVLSKRKTPMMRALEDRERDEAEKKLKKKPKKKSVAVEKTEASKLNYERSLRKTATRAVVALFNAISEHQNAQDDATSYKSEATKKGSYGDKVAAVKDVQRKTTAAILDLNAKDRQQQQPKADEADDVPVNSWARDDFLLDTAGGEWDDDDDDDAEEEDEPPPPTKTRNRNDNQPPAFLYPSSKGGGTRRHNRV